MSVLASGAAVLMVMAAPTALHQASDGIREAPTPKPVTGTPTVPPTATQPQVPLVAPPPDRPMVLDEQSPYAPVVTRVPTRNKVVFLTIDDGGFRPREAKKLLTKTEVPTTLFLIGNAAGQAPYYFRSLRDHGATLHSHTSSHAKLAGRSPEWQRHEICGAVKRMRRLFGSPVSLFRPPFGMYDRTTQSVARQCGVRAVVMWDASVIGGGLYVGKKPVSLTSHPLRPGMIILMHFTPHFKKDFDAILSVIKRDGYSVGQLEDYTGSERVNTSSRNSPEDRETPDRGKKGRVSRD